MRVAVVGATGVIGRAVVPALLAAGHDVVGLARSPENAVVLRRLGAEASRTDPADPARLVAMLEGADAVCNFATHVPVGPAAAVPRAWRTHDRLRTDGVRRVLTAARAAGVRRVVQESVSFLYADRGDDWVDEDSQLEITRGTEPAAVGEACVQDYACGSRAGVVLRLGTLVGDDPITRSTLRSAARGHGFGLGSPEGWAHVLHVDDLGSAALAALTVPSGTYNVGAEPVRRDDLVTGFARAAGRREGRFVGPVVRRVGGARLEPLTRSLRVSSERFAAQGGWSPSRPVFGADWFAPSKRREALR